MKDINLIRKIAWKFAKKTKLDYDDLFQEAALRYCMALEDWDESKKKNCSFSSFAYRRMYFRLINFCKEQSKIANTTIHIEDLLKMYGDPDQENPDWVLQDLGLAEEPEESIFEKIEDWPEHCIYVVEQVLEDPDRFFKESPNFRRTDKTPKRRMKDFLLDQGWTHANVNSVVKEMKGCVASL